MKRCWHHIMLTMQDKIPCYTAMDQVRAFDAKENWVVGEYKLPEFEMLPGLIKKSDWWPSTFAQTAVENKWVKREDIKWVLPASYYYDPKCFANMLSL